MESSQRHQGKKKYTFVIPRVGKVFLAIVIAEVFVVVATSAVIIAAQSSTASVAYTFMVLVTTLFLGYFAVQAVTDENPYQLGATILVSCLLTIRVVFHLVYSESNGGDKTASAFVIVCAVAVSCIQFAYVPLGVMVYKSFGWKTFKRVGALAHVIDLFKTYQFFLSILKLDVQFVVDMAMMAFFFVAYHWAEWFVVAGTVVTILVSYMAVEIGVKLERPRTMLFFFIFSVFVAPPYVIYKLVQIYGDDRHINHVSGATEEETKIFLTISAILFLVWRALMAVGLIIVWRNFGKGLKESVFDKEGPSSIFSGVLRRVLIGEGEQETTALV